MFLTVATRDCKNAGRAYPDPAPRPAGLRPGMGLALLALWLLAPWPPPAPAHPAGLPGRPAQPTGAARATGAPPRAATLTPPTAAALPPRAGASPPGPAPFTTAAPPDRSREEGFPFIRNYLPRETGGGPENMAVVQDKRGIIYVANQEGILEYDGVSWRLIRIAGKSLVNSLAVDKNGTIFVGGIGEIGFLEPDPRGQMHYISLKGKVDENACSFSNVLSIHTTTAGVYFRALEYLFLWTGDKIIAWKSASEFLRSFSVREKIYLWQRGTGILEMSGNSLRRLAGCEKLVESEVRIMLPIGPHFQNPDTATSRKTMLIGTLDSLFLYDGISLIPYRNEAESLIRNRILKNGGILSDGKYLLMMKAGGLIILDDRGNIKCNLDKARGLKDDIVHGYCEDQEGGLWLALSNGLSRLEISSSFSLFDERSGLHGVIWSIIRHQGKVFVGTNTGVYVMGSEARAGNQPANRTEDQIFSPLKQIKGYGWEFLPVGDTLLVSSSGGVYEIRMALIK